MDSTDLMTEDEYKVALDRSIDIFNAETGTPEHEELAQLLPVITKHEDINFLIPELSDDEIAKYNKDVADAEARIEAGEFTTQEQLEKEMAEEWDEETIKEHNKDINEAVAEFDRGEFLTKEEAEKEIENWKNESENKN